MSLDEILGTLSNHGSFVTTIAPDSPPTLAQYEKSLGQLGRGTKATLPLITPTCMYTGRAKSVGVADNIMFPGNLDQILSTFGLEGIACKHFVGKSLYPGHSAGIFGTLSVARLVMKSSCSICLTPKRMFHPYICKKIEILR